MWSSKKYKGVFHFIPPLKCTMTMNWSKNIRIRNVNGVNINIHSTRSSNRQLVTLDILNHKRCLIFPLKEHPNLVVYQSHYLIDNISPCKKKKKKSFFKLEQKVPAKFCNTMGKCERYKDSWRIQNQEFYNLL